MIDIVIVFGQGSFLVDLQCIRTDICGSSLVLVMVAHIDKFVGGGIDDDAPLYLRFHESESRVRQLVSLVISYDHRILVMERQADAVWALRRGGENGNNSKGEICCEEC